MIYQITRLTPSDTFSIKKWIDTFFIEDESPGELHLKTLLTDDRTYIYIATIDKEIKVIGYCLVYTFPSLYSNHKLAYLYDIEVIEEYRRKGVGREFIKVVKEQLSRDNVNELWLGTATDNESGQALFSKTGGIRSGETFNDFTYVLKGG